MARALDGIKVIDLATFVAAPSAARFLADQGADVIKVEAIGGDVLRWGTSSDGIPSDPHENIIYDIENGNKRSISLNLKDPECFDVLKKLIAQCDIFITNWRPNALKKMGLDYESLSSKYPAIVYGSITGYGDCGPDVDLPGYDATAFFARSGLQASLHEKDAMPANWFNSMGDRQAGMILAAGVLAALYQAKTTGHGDCVTVSLLATAIFSQATPLEASEYGKVKYPLRKQELVNPLMGSYQTKDDRWIQLALPVYDMMATPFANAIGHPEWREDPRFTDFKTLNDGSGNNGKFYDTVAEEFKKHDAKEIIEILTKADLPHSLAQTWDEVLVDKQAWATDCFVEMDYPSGKRTVVRNPVRFKNAGIPEFKKSPLVGENSVEILEELGYSKEWIDGQLEKKNLRIMK